MNDLPPANAPEPVARRAIATGCAIAAQGMILTAWLVAYVFHLPEADTIGQMQLPATMFIILVIPCVFGTVGALFLVMTRTATALTILLEFTVAVRVIDLTGPEAWIDGATAVVIAGLLFWHVGGRPHRLENRDL